MKKHNEERAIRIRQEANWAVRNPQMNMIILLWAHPRSMSTAMERIMRERGDCHCLHEPFLYYYYLHLGRKQFPHFDADPDRPTGFMDIVAMMRRQSEAGTVFAKDMAYYVLPEIFDHPELASAFHHAFLVRDPRKSILSYYRLDPKLLREEIGLKAQWRLFQWIRQVTGTEPPVVRAEDIQHDPRGVVGALWRVLGIDHIEDAFSWQAGTMPEDWAEVSTWHERTASRSAIEPDNRDNEEIQEEFDALAADVPMLAEYLDYHWPYYLELSSRALIAGS
jgi:hypothetical protein